MSPFFLYWQVFKWVQTASYSYLLLAHPVLVRHRFLLSPVAVLLYVQFLGLSHSPTPFVPLCGSMVQPMHSVFELLAQNHRSYRETYDP